MPGRVTGVDQEIAVHFRHLRAADAQAAAAGGVDQLPGAVAGRILEGRAAGLFADRLRGFAVVLHLVHPRPDRVRRGDGAAKARRGENDRRDRRRCCGRRISCRRWSNRMFAAVAADAGRLDQHVLGLGAVGAGIHAQRAADGAGDAEEEFQPAEIGRRRRLGDALVERGGAGADDIAVGAGFAEAARASLGSPRPACRRRARSDWSRRRRHRPASSCGKCARK